MTDRPHSIDDNGDNDGLSHQERRERATRKIMDETGIDQQMIHNVVHGFYTKVRADPFLGPIFDARISDWDGHLQNMCQFWSSVALASGAYYGRPMQKHMPLPIDRHHFDQWLALFAETLAELCPPVAARHFMERALRIAQSFEVGIAAHNGVILSKGERYDPVSSWQPK
ncbi:group III truncated hemoglobin [Thalassospira sp. MCCC 1A01428]|uniref:group III truncated hemoglobin n=1 Tax=Thalassospira sp. MCCC 1A01428 TaxID=1470575 RepID=UPI000A1FD5EE|nr:group III truncated hemoglobin [Thalassospira sp. MCCC 1A01428]OSQ42182.1 preprotein translocase subunit TatC [Thalassospira sp. MCCC 1A01428]